MRTHGRLNRACLGLIFVMMHAGTAAHTLQAKSATENVRTALRRLPYYGAFDFIAFGYLNGVVTLTGYAYEGRLKLDAERAG